MGKGCEICILALEITVGFLSDGITDFCFIGAE
jgi:hypothetical protein